MCQMQGLVGLQCVNAAGSSDVGSASLSIRGMLALPMGRCAVPWPSNCLHRVKLLWLHS